MGCDRDNANGFVGVFDSGVGGISVLKSLVAELPGEDFRFFGDSAHAPYGEKTVERVRELSHDIVERFVADGAKAIVIACNTATSAAAPGLRAEYPDLPIIGIEPAEQKIVAVKSSVHFRADFQPIASEVIVVTAPGPVVADPAVVRGRRRGNHVLVASPRPWDRSEREAVERAVRRLPLPVRTWDPTDRALPQPLPS